MTPKMRAALDQLGGAEWHIASDLDGVHPATLQALERCGLADRFLTMLGHDRDYDAPLRFVFEYRLAKKP